MSKRIISAQHARNTAAQGKAPNPLADAQAVVPGVVNGQATAFIQAVKQVPAGKMHKADHAAPTNTDADQAHKGDHADAQPQVAHDTASVELTASGAAHMMMTVMDSSADQAGGGSGSGAPAHHPHHHNDTPIYLGIGALAVGGIVAATVGGGSSPTPTPTPTPTPHVNVAPVNTVPGAQTTAENAPKVITGLSVSDSDTGTSTNNLVTLSATHGTLTVLAATGVTIGTNGTASVTLTGSLANIDAALAAANGVTYNPTTNFFGTDTLTMVSNDEGNTGTGGALTATSTVGVTVTEVNQAPVNTVPGAQAAVENTSKVITGLSVSDVDTGTSTNNLVTLSVAHGTLTVLAASGVTIGGNGTGSVTLTGSLANIDAALATASEVTYNPTHNFSGVDTLTMVSNDEGNTGAGGPLTATSTVGINVAAVNQAPVNTVPGAQAAQENAAHVITGISVSDVDVGTGNLTETLTALDGTLSLGNTSGLTFSAGANGTGSMTFTGTASAVNAALASVTYQAIQDYVGPDTITLLTNDNGNTGAGGPMTATSTIGVTVAAAPTNHSIDNGTNPVTFDASQPDHVTAFPANASAYNFTDSETAPTNITITNFGANDHFTFSTPSHTGADYSFTSDGAGDLLITASYHPGLSDAALNTITIAHVVSPSAFVDDQTTAEVALVAALGPASGAAHYLTFA